MSEPAAHPGKSDPSDQSDLKTKPTRSLTAFYVALGVLGALALFGFWFWRTYTVWWFDADEAKRRQTAAAARLGVPIETAIDLGGGVKLDLVLVPGGRFQMGHRADELMEGWKRDQHWVMIGRPFYMGKCEVTQEQWERVTGKNPSEIRKPKNPVENVSWNDCQEFLKKLNAMVPHPGPLPAAGEGAERKGGFRLPTEAEWEWACRAGTRTRFCFGDDHTSLAEYAWCDANAGNTHHPVGEKKPNAWGLYDLHGHVWEWCSDWYEYVEYERSSWAPLRDPTGPPAGSGRVVRGGAWPLHPGDLRSAKRLYFYPTERDLLIGFRVAFVAGGP